MSDERPFRKTRYVNKRLPRKPAGEPSSDIRELWEDGIELSDAWSIFAETEVLEKWRTAPNQDAWVARSHLMQADLIADLQSGELIAIGIAETSATYEAPEIIHADLFDSFSENVRSIFNDTTRLVLAGRAWVQVRVTERRWTPAPNIKTDHQAGLVTSRQTKMGRPTNSQTIQQIIRELVKAGLDLEATNQKQVCEEVRGQAQKRGLRVASGFSDPVIKSNLRRVRAEMRDSES